MGVGRCLNDAQYSPLHSCYGARSAISSQWNHAVSNLGVNSPVKVRGDKRSKLSGKEHLQLKKASRKCSIIYSGLQFKQAGLLTQAFQKLNYNEAENTCFLLVEELFTIAMAIHRRPR